MKSKKIQLQIPDYLTVEEYQKIYAYTPETEIEFLVNVICAFSGLTVEEVRQWSIGSLAEAANQIVNIANVTGEFYPIVEFNGTVYGYSQIEKASLGEFIDLEAYSKDTITNLHKIASILYRPITKHKFGTWKWDIKSAWKQAKNQVENPLNYYTVEEYNSDICFDREQEFKQFPVHLVLGALTFFLALCFYRKTILYTRWRF